MPSRPKHPLEGRAEARGRYLLEHMRDICLDLPEVSETLKWGNPTFVAGRKMFAVLDRYDGRWAIAFRGDPGLLERPEFFPAPYSARYGWICLDAEGRINWVEVRQLLVDSYRSVALKRMLAAMG